MYDPLQFGVELPHRAEFSPLGFGLRLRTNSEKVLDVARECWDAFPRRFDEPPVDVSVVVGEGEAIGEKPPVFRGLGHQFLINAGSDNFAACDFDQGAAVCWTTEATVERRASFRYHLLETMVFLLLTQRYLTPLHASCVELNGHGVLFCGAAEAGKSTLAFGCARRGWTFVSDDATWLVRRADDRTVLGRPHQMRFRTTAAELFAELEGRLARRRPNGKVSVEVPTAEFPELRTALSCRADYVVFLDRRETGPVSTRPVGQSEAMDRLIADIPFLGSRTHAEYQASLGRLSGARTLALTYSDLEDAIARLTALVRDE